MYTQLFLMLTYQSIVTTTFIKQQPNILTSKHSPLGMHASARAKLWVQTRSSSGFQKKVHTLSKHHQIPILNLHISNDLTNRVHDCTHITAEMKKIDNN
jgi:hypothetical protein